LDDHFYWDYLHEQRSHISLSEIMKQMRLRDANGTVLLNPALVTSAGTDTVEAYAINSQQFWLSFSGAICWPTPGQDNLEFSMTSPSCCC
jgi:hypothetical protein